MTKIWLLSLLLSLTGCFNETTKDVSGGKKLDTSFLKLGEAGDISYNSNLPSSGHIHVLADDQNIEIISQNGEVKIENFDYADLADNDVIIGNEKDQFLLKYKKANNSSHTNSDTIILSPAQITDITRDNEGSISFEMTPEIEYDASEARTLQKHQVGESDSNIANSSGSGRKVNPGKFNIIDFKDYELLNISGQAQLLGNGLKSGKKTQVNINHGQELKVTIDRGLMEFIPTFRGDFNFTGMNKYNLKTSFDALVRYDFQITIETKGKTVGEVSFPLFKSKKIPVRIPGPVPVYMDLELDFPAGVKIGTQKGGKLSYRIKSEYALTAQTFYDSKSGKQVTSHYDFVVNKRDIEKIQDQNSYLFELFFEPRVKTKFYKVLGPYAYINSNIQANIQIPLRPKEKDIFVNFSGGVGATLEDPIFGATLIDVQTPSLFNLSKGWDIIGPKPKKGMTYNIHLKEDINLDINNLDERNRVALNLRPENLSPLGQVRVYKSPSFGRLVLTENFQSTGIAYYYPPKVIEGKDSFQIQVIERGIESKPSRIVLEFSTEAKNQAKAGATSLLPNYNSDFLNAATVNNITGLPSGSFSFSENFPASGNGKNKKEKPSGGSRISNIPEPTHKPKTIKLKPLKIGNLDSCDDTQYLLHTTVSMDSHFIFDVKTEITGKRNENIRLSPYLEQLRENSKMALDLHLNNANNSHYWMDIDSVLDDATTYTINYYSKDRLTLKDEYYFLYQDPSRVKEKNWYSGPSSFEQEYIYLRSFKKEMREYFKHTPDEEMKFLTERDLPGYTNPNLRSNDPWDERIQEEFQKLSRPSNLPSDRKCDEEEDNI